MMCTSDTIIADRGTEIGLENQTKMRVLYAIWEGVEDKNDSTFQLEGPKCTGSLIHSSFLFPCYLLAHLGELHEI